MKAFKIQLDKPSCSYFAGQLVTGKIILDLDSAKKTTGLKLRCLGRSGVSWVVRTGRNRRTYSDKEVHFDYKNYLIGSSDNTSNILLEPGLREISFTFQLPLGIPSSFKSDNGFVQYSLIATLKKSFGFGSQTSLLFTINGIVDLNTFPGAGNPSTLYKSKYLGCLCWKDGPISFNFNLYRQGYVPGEPLHYMLEMSNMSSRRVHGVKLKLLMDVGVHARGESCHKFKKIIEFQGPGVAPGDSKLWHGADSMRIPSLPPTNLGGSRIITINYKLEVEMEISNPTGFTNNLSGSIPIIIGTIPFRNDFQYLQSGDRNPQRSMLINEYPDLPPPAYEEAYSDVGSLPTYEEATVAEHLGIHGRDPSTKFDLHFRPRYVTYEWISPTHCI